MCLGVAIFVLLYTWGDQLTQRQAWRQFGPTRLALKIGYGTRLLMSLAFPLGLGLDLICGLMSVGLVQSLWPELVEHPGGAADLEGHVRFVGALLITLVQGVVLNVALLGYMTIVLGIIMAVHSWKHTDV